MSQKEDATLPSAVTRGAVAVLVLGALLAGIASPLAAAVAERLGCHCPVPMQCCQRDMCTMGEDASSGPALSSCDSPSREGLPVPAVILAIVPAPFVLAIPSHESNAALLAVVRPVASPFSSDSPPPRSSLFS